MIHEKSVLMDLTKFTCHTLQPSSPAYFWTPVTREHTGGYDKHILKFWLLNIFVIASRNKDHLQATIITSCTVSLFAIGCVLNKTDRIGIYLIATIGFIATWSCDSQQSCKIRSCRNLPHNTWTKEASQWFMELSTLVCNLLLAQYLCFSFKFQTQFLILL